MKYFSWTKEELKKNQQMLDDEKMELSPWRFLKFTIRKVIATRMKYLAGDPALQPKPFDELYTVRNFDRVYIEEPYAWRKLKRPLWQWVVKKASERGFL